MICRSEGSSPLRRRKELKPDSTGQFVRELGWKPNRAGTKLVQPKFRLGTNQSRAEVSLRRLEMLWAIVESNWNQDAGKPRWNLQTLEIAKAVSRGASTFVLPNSEAVGVRDDKHYFFLLHHLRETYSSVIAIDGEDQQAVQTVEDWIADGDMILRRSMALTQKWTNGELDGSQPTLHDALDAYCDWIKQEYRTTNGNGSEENLTDWGRAQLRNVARLKDRHADVPLVELDREMVDEAVRFWRQRPNVKGTNRPIKPKTAKHHVKQLFAFLNWLHDSDAFEWELNFDLRRIKTKVELTRQEQVARYTPIQADVYSLDELRILNQYATPIERFLLLVALNCGAGISEIAGLLLREIALGQSHPHADLLHFTTSDDDSFIKGPRPKTGVYGEFLLWRETVRAIEWALVRRKKQKRITAGPRKGEDISPTPDSHLVLTEQGQDLTQQTKGGNRVQRIPNLWAALLRRVRKDHPDFRQLSFNKLRKTAGDLVKKFSNGEVAGVFLRHGKVVKSDDLIDLYTNRPFAKVFEALGEVEKYLQPMFDATPIDPFPEKRKKGGPNITPGQIRRIRSLRKQGFKIKKIAEEVGVSTQTVHRHSRKSVRKEK